MLSPTRSSRRKERRNPSVTPRRFGRFFTPRSSMSTQGRKILGMLDDTAINHRLLASPQSLMLGLHDDEGSSDPIGPPSPTEMRTNANRAGIVAQDHDHDHDHDHDQERQERDRGYGRGKRRMPDIEEESPSKRRRVGRPASEEMPPPPLNLTESASRNLNQSQSQSQPQQACAPEADAEPKSGQESLCEQRKATLNLFFKVSRNGAQEKDAKSSPRSHKSSAVAPKTPSVLETYEPQVIRKFRNRGGAAHLLDREHGLFDHAGSSFLACPALDPRIETSAFCSRSLDSTFCTTHSGTGSTIPFSMASCHRASVTAIGDEQGYVRLFNTTMTTSVTEPKVDAFIPVHDNAIMGLAFSDDDMRLATAAGDRTAKIVDIATQTVAAELAGSHWDSLRQASFQPGKSNGSILATSDRAGQIQIWDLRCSPSPQNAFSVVEDGVVRSRDTALEPYQGKTINTIQDAHQRSRQSTVSAASVTAIQWMPVGREHLLLSASEANASIKLWDTRYIKPRRQLALAVTPEPQSHGWRSYGITSMALSSDASRLYALCRDSTVYAYATSHLMLGRAPELLDGAHKRKPIGVEGLGPLYGFKNPNFRAQSFYVKCSLRPSINGSSEILAVGSTDGCAVLFPTDERYLHRGPSSSLPISKAGTPLIRGHSREVTTLAWTHDGKLVTASDDYIIRQWQQDERQARHFRQIGEFGGERHMAGWADVGQDWDDAM
ncbi:Cell division cycle protein cdt2 [Escovopsis weberi]|uniref:Cell division cycle protein cdt2 n=1 Tax=Escovopsis weberi TaxID=150374 RepID=A0A0M8N151_ESCWE|nr:Cell division cycle protein cdt2 [Escovopsis weberi]